MAHDGTTIHFFRFPGSPEFSTLAADSWKLVFKVKAAAEDTARYMKVPKDVLQLNISGTPVLGLGSSL